MHVPLVSLRALAAHVSTDPGRWPTLRGLMARTHDDGSTSLMAVDGKKALWVRLPGAQLLNGSGPISVDPASLSMLPRRKLIADVQAVDGCIVVSTLGASVSLPGIDPGRAGEVDTLQRCVGDTLKKSRGERVVQVNARYLLDLLRSIVDLGADMVRLRVSQANKAVGIFADVPAEGGGEASRVEACLMPVNMTSEQEEDAHA